MSSWWGPRRGGHGRLDEHVERINEIANGLVAVSLAMQAEEPEAARRTADETLWQASRLLSEAVAQAEARARRRRAVTGVASVTAAVAVAAAIAVSVPDLGPTADLDRLAADGVPAEVRVLDGVRGHAPPARLRDREAASLDDSTPVVAVTLADRRAALPPTDAPAGTDAADHAPQVTAASMADDVRDAPQVTAASTTDDVRHAPTPSQPDSPSDTADEPAETHPGVLASGRAQPSGNARPGAASGPPAHANVSGRAGAMAAATKTDA